MKILLLHSEIFPNLPVTVWMSLITFVQCHSQHTEIQGLLKYKASLMWFFGLAELYLLVITRCAVKNQYPSVRLSCRSVAAAAACGLAAEVGRGQ